MSLSLTAAAAYVADYRNPYERDEWLVAYQTDLLAPFGVAFEEQRLERGPGILFQELAEHALDRLPEPPAPDLIVVAYGMNDLYPFRCIGGHVDRLLGGGSENFAVSEQGLRAPFTALRIADAYARSGRCRQGAVVVVEQSTIGNDDPIARDGLADSAAILVLGSGGPWRLGTIPPASPHLTALITQAAGGQPALVVAGPWTDPTAVAAAGLPVHQVSRGSYCTSVWLDLARHHETWAHTENALVLCDTDPRTGRSHAALLRRHTEESA
ncbi:hypothetical protein [Actinocrispum sp. NPDC049592]|uniref:hypothetical protein n=1 Tax=Actinocrispum sp. NPDC049592 TaxID=3154835 RepID=UPI003438F8A1